MNTYNEIPQLTCEQIQRFFKNVRHDSKTGCLLWAGIVSERGYGQFFVANRQYTAHRVMQAIAGNRVPLDMQLNHTCGRKNCLNHVTICTASENIRHFRDFEAGGWQQKLNRQQVSNIKRLMICGARDDVIADAFNVSKACINAIRRLRSWADVDSHLDLPQQEQLDRPSDCQEELAIAALRREYGLD